MNTAAAGPAPPGRWTRWFVPRRPFDLHPPAYTTPPPTPQATLLAAAAVGWGLWIGLVAGATAGTLIVPLFGTVYGAVIGLTVAVLPALVGASLVAAASRRHRLARDPGPFAADLTRLFARLAAALVVLGVAIAALTAGAAAEGGLPAVLGTAAWAAVVVAGTTVVTAALLRRAALALIRRHAVAHGWTRVPS